MIADLDTEFLIVTILVGLGTWMLRYLPIRLMRGSADPDAPFSRFLAATGPAAIAALYIGSVVPMVAPDMAANAPLFGGTVAVVLAYYWRRDVTIATLCGAIVYGLIFAGI
jgi:branched-subunit amino acid transport protein